MSSACKIAVYAIAGAFAGLAGVMEFSRLSVGDPTVAIGAELGVIAAVIIGGGSLSGGKGTVVGTIAGAGIMTLIQIGCSQHGLPNWVQEIVTGTIIVFAVALDHFRIPRVICDENYRSLLFWISDFPRRRIRSAPMPCTPIPTTQRRTSSSQTDGGLEGHGLTFTVGRGNEVCAAAIEAFRHLVVGRDLRDITSDFGGFWHSLAGNRSCAGWGPRRA